ncbi:MAG: L-glutamate gamma-semialdehyde dehydrogenase [Vicinamibacteria bacterium]|jgi:1-pyrroline-5-carboxylate dehydrogenase|nr:L-glutamate gamma-semialdehyde dehydrogenase [Vicinamibacteria bacterium]
MADPRLLSHTNGRLRIPAPINEPVKSYAPGSPEKKELKARLDAMAAERIEIPVVVGGKRITTDKQARAVMPHAHGHVLADWHKARKEDVAAAVDAAREAQRDWANWPFEDRAAIFLKAAELLAGPWRATLNAATMLGQSKTAYQAEIDSACEVIDFLRFNPHFAQELLADQPVSSPGMWNQTDLRPLEGFVYAITPFNFTAIGANLPTAPALMGNTVVWKPASTAVLSGWYMMRLLEEAGLPPGVINFVPGDSSAISDILLNHRDLAGVHFTGSTGVFNMMWRTIGANMDRYRSYPRIVGETGGKDFIMVHPSADRQAVAVAAVRGAFEYQGQKCSAASRMYVPKSMWPDLRDRMVALMKDIKVGDVRDFRNFMGAVIDGKAFDSIAEYVDHAKANARVIQGGGYDKTTGFFVEPTLVEAPSADYRLLCEEIFGPVLTVWVYEDAQFEETLALVDRTSPYALTGSIFAQDRQAVRLASLYLRNAAGNFYINDKPTGAVVGQQPFGGARGSGTNDKAGSKLNLLRWVNARTIKETFAPPQDYRYPFLAEE